MSRRGHLRLAARIAVMALLFAQGILAFAGCEMPGRAAAAAIAADDQPCHASGGEANLCVAHCLSGDQSLDKPQVSVPQPAAAPVLLLHAVSDAQSAHATALRYFAPPAAAPPPRILFRTLRI